jgi:hypothetical protein
MSNYQITLSSAEDMALSFAAVSQNDWIQHAVHHRCAAAIDEIVAVTVQKCLETNTAIPSSKDAMVELAFQRGWVKTAAERHAEVVAAAAALDTAQAMQNETNTNV